MKIDNKKITYMEKNDASDEHTINECGMCFKKTKSVLMSAYYKDYNEYSYMNVFLCDDCIFEYIKMLQRG